MKFNYRTLISLLAICLCTSAMYAQCGDSDLTCPTIPTTIPNDPDLCSADVAIGPVTSTDACGIATVAIDGPYDNGNDASGVYIVGMTEVTYNVTFENGDTGSCSFVVNVVDTQPPSFSVPASSITIADLTNCNSALPEHIDLNPNDILDNCDLTDVDVEKDTTFVVDICGGYPVTYSWIAIDGVGNRDTLSTTFNVPADDANGDPNDINAPQIEAGTVFTMIENIGCGDGLPVAQEVEAEDGCSDAVVMVIIDTIGTVDVCSNFTIQYTWMPIDGCGNTGLTVSNTFDVEADPNPPTIETPIDTVFVFTDEGLCSADLMLDLPMVNSGGCAGITSVTYMPNITVFDVGETTITWTVENECGLTATSDQVIVVQDNVGPNLNCKDSLTVSLNNLGTAEINVSHIMIDAMDLCSGPIDMSLELMTDVGCGDTDDVKTVNVCCGNVNFETMIMGVATDHAEPPVSTICMVVVTVLESTPSISPMECVPDVTVSCDYDVDLMNLFEFGTLVHLDSMPATIELVDPIAAPATYQDGFYSNGCPDAVITEAYIDTRECNQGNITRTLYVTNETGLQDSCKHTITVEDNNPFNMADITWPDDVTINGCEATATDLPEPIFSNDNCSTVGVSVDSTKIFDDPNSGCIVVYLDWTLVDWCQYESNEDNPDGVFTHRQTIYYQDTDPPEFQNCQDTTICIAYNACEGPVDLSAYATDTCTDSIDIQYSYQVDLDNNDTFDLQGLTGQYIDTLDFGIHRIQWVAHDRCGNRDTCDVIFEVKDCKAPTAACINGIGGNLNVMIVGSDTMPMLMIEPTLFDASSADFCTSYEDLLFSFSTNTNDTLLTYTCDSIGLRKVDVYVTDEAGNQSFCITHIDVQDNFELCPATSEESEDEEEEEVVEEETEEEEEEEEEIIEEVFVGGSLVTERNEPLSNVEIILQDESQLNGIMTSEDGSYMFESLPMYSNYSLSAKRDSHYLNGVSTIDIVVIQRHLLGLENIDSPYKIIAADVNNSNSLSASDMSDIRKLILGVDDSFDQVESWVFIDSDQTFLDDSNPWEYQQSMELSNLDHDAPNMDFTAIKMGDVDNSVNLTPGVETENRAENKHLNIVKNGSVFDLVSGFDMFSYGLQFTLEIPSIDLEDFRIESDYFSNEDIYIATHEDKQAISLSVALMQPVHILKGSTLFTITSNTGSSVLINSSITKSEIYDNNFNDYPLSIQKRALNDPSSSIKMDQNAPNPFKDYTTVDFEIETDAVLAIEIFDVLGNKVFSGKKSYLRGLNTILIDETMINNTKGVLIITIGNEKYSTSKKMLRL